MLAAGREHIDGYPDYLAQPAPVHRPEFSVARLTNPAVRCVGISVNTKGMAADARHVLLDGIASEFGLPCFDPVANGTLSLVEQLRKWP